MREERDRTRAPHDTDGAEEEEAALIKRWPWLLPLAGGIFATAAALEMMPEALAQAGERAWLWAAVGLVAFVLVRDGLDYLGQHGLAWVTTLGI